jgi:hypothetical protein
MRLHRSWVYLLYLTQNSSPLSRQHSILSGFLRLNWPIVNTPRRNKITPAALAEYHDDIDSRVELATSTVIAYHHSSNTSRDHNMGSSHYYLANFLRSDLATPDETAQSPTAGNGTIIDMVVPLTSRDVYCSRLANLLLTMLRYEA